MTEMEPLAETREALAELVSFDDPDVDELLQDLGERARGIVPQLVGLSLGLASEGLTFTIVASGTAAAALDAAQYLDGGPCVEVTEGRSDARADDDRRPPRRGALGPLRAGRRGGRRREQPLDAHLPRRTPGGRRQPLRVDRRRLHRPPRRPRAPDGDDGGRGGQQRRPLVLDPAGGGGRSGPDPGPHRHRHRRGTAGRTPALRHRHRSPASHGGRRARRDHRGSGRARPRPGARTPARQVVGRSAD